MAFKEGDKWSEKFDRFWELDRLGILPNEESVYEHYVTDIRYVEGRYEVKLPFKDNHPIIEDNYMHSLKRLKTLKRKMENLPEKLKAYDDVIKKQLDDGIIEKIDVNEAKPSPGAVTYLPHRGVYHHSKPPRIVYDASAKTTGLSLNDCLLKGPCLTPLIFNALLKFRLHRIALTADIEKAYLQISVFPPHRDFMRFMWFSDIESGNPEIVIYRFLRVIFGANCSQFILNAVLRKLIEGYKHSDPDFVHKLKNALYVDDLTTGVETLPEGMELYEKCKARFAGGNFNLRKWRSNNSELRKYFDEKEGMGGKVLGMLWDEDRDTLTINYENLANDIDGSRITKRSMLKVVAGCFDPTGHAQHIVVQLKIMFQEACKMQLKWDEVVSVELAKKWNDTIIALKRLGKLTFPRYYHYTEENNPVKFVEIVGFSDASFSAYGCCVYLKFILENGNSKISLVAAKSRIAPLKNKLTIPRL